MQDFKPSLDVCVVDIRQNGTSSKASLVDLCNDLYEYALKSKNDSSQNRSFTIMLVLHEECDAVSSIHLKSEGRFCILSKCYYDGKETLKELLELCKCCYGSRSACCLESVRSVIYAIPQRDSFEKAEEETPFVSFSDEFKYCLFVSSETKARQVSIQNNSLKFEKRIQYLTHAFETDCTPPRDYSLVFVVESEDPLRDRALYIPRESHTLLCYISTFLSLWVMRMIFSRAYMTGRNRVLGDEGGSYKGHSEVFWDFIARSATKYPRSHFYSTRIAVSSLEVHLDMVDNMNRSECRESRPDTRGYRVRSWLRAIYSLFLYLIGLVTWIFVYDAREAPGDRKSDMSRYLDKDRLLGSEENGKQAPISYRIEKKSFSDKYHRGNALEVDSDKLYRELKAGSRCEVYSVLWFIFIHSAPIAGLFMNGIIGPVLIYSLFSGSIATWAILFSGRLEWRRSGMSLNAVAFQKSRFGSLARGFFVLCAKLVCICLLSLPVAIASTLRTVFLFFERAIP